MTVVRDDSGEVTGVVANVPGTEHWGPVAGDNPMDLTGNAAQAGPAGHSAGAEATADAIDQLYREHGIPPDRSEEHTSELQSRGHLVCRLLLEKKKYQSTNVVLLLFERRGQRYAHED